jgi:predicted transcriptional regulator
MAEKIIFKIGKGIKKDIRKVFKNPSLLKSNTHAIYFKNWADLLDALSPKKMHLLQKLLNYTNKKKPLNIQSLSKKTNRKQEAVSRDIRILEQNGLIIKNKKGKNVFPTLTAKEIVIKLS